MTFDDAIKSSKTLKQLDRVVGSEGHKDYFCVLSKKQHRFCMKVDFLRNMLGQPVAFFARVRVVKGSTIDIANMESDLNADVFGNRKTLEKALSKKPIKAVGMKAAPERLSFVIKSTQMLSDYGNINEDYDGVVEAMRSDLGAIGNRVYDAIRVFEPDATENIRMVIQGCMRDFATMFKPPKPEGGKGGKVKKLH